ncbi:MAG: type II methionyl aminopeptidase [Candidatus Micrarchaeia archaeon]
MDEETKQKYLEAGKIASEALAYAKKKLKPGIQLLELADSVEAKIIEQGGGIAFPINLSSNNVAAHDTPVPGDDRVLGGHDLLKVDVGVQVDGYIADCAFSYSADPSHGQLIGASRAALDAAIATIKPGVVSREVGKAISDAITSRGFNPVVNLCGHALGRYTVHAGEEVPNVPHGSYEFAEGDVFAVEPFATTGEGVVRDHGECQIFRLSEGKSRLAQSRQLAKNAEKYRGLPFCRRWLARDFPSTPHDLAISDLVRCGGLEDYYPLAEKSGRLVSQAENTLIVTGDGCVPTVKLPA